MITATAELRASYEVSVFSVPVERRLDSIREGTAWTWEQFFSCGRLVNPDLQRKAKFRSPIGRSGLDSGPAT